MNANTIKFLKLQAPAHFINGEFQGDENDASCIISGFCQTLAAMGQAETAATLALQLQPAGFIHATHAGLVSFYARQA